MTKREWERYDRLKTTLATYGVTEAEFVTLLRAERTLHRWAELECGDSNDYGSWAIERDENGDGPPYLVHHRYQHGQGRDTITRRKIADRETGARKRVIAIAQAHGLTPYFQTDPRGGALWLLRPNDLIPACDIDSYYTRGLSLCLE